MPDGTATASRKVHRKVGDSTLRHARRPSRTNLIHIGIMAAVLIGSVVTVALASGGIGSTGHRERHGIRLWRHGEQAGRTKKADKADKADVDVTVTGTLGTRIAADGSTEYTLTSGDTVLLLDAGPAWFFRDAYPLAPFVGKQVTIGGEQKGSTSVDVLTVDGTALREPGRPGPAAGRRSARIIRGGRRRRPIARRPSRPTGQPGGPPRWSASASSAGLPACARMALPAT